jgi:ubiquinone/menaquinone biosynthesis C-methylase UbiE
MTMPDSSAHKLPSALETIADYTEHSMEYADNYQSRADLDELSSFMHHLNPGSLVIDAGCAAGRDTKLLEQEGFQAIGIDISAGMIEQARERHPDLTFIQASMLRIPLGNNSVDGIWARASLVHMETKKDTVDALHELFRVLIPGGTIFIRVKARSDNDIETGYEADSISGGRTRFFRYYTLDEIIGYAKESGFEIVEAEQFNEKDRADKMADMSIMRDIDWITFIANKA